MQPDQPPPLPVEPAASVSSVPATPSGSVAPQLVQPSRDAGEVRGDSSVQAAEVTGDLTAPSTAGTPGRPGAVGVTEPDGTVAAGEGAEPTGAGGSGRVVGSAALPSAEVDGGAGSLAAGDVEIDPFAPVVPTGTAHGAGDDLAETLSGDAVRETLPPAFRTSLDRIEAIGPETQSAGYQRAADAYMEDLASGPLVPGDHAPAETPDQSDDELVRARYSAT